MILANDEAASTANKRKCTYRDFILYILMNSIFRGTEEEEEKNNNLMDAEMGGESQFNKAKFYGYDGLYSHVIMAKSATQDWTLSLK